MSVLAKGMDMAVAWYVGSRSVDPRIEVSNRYLEAHVQHGYIYLMNNVRVHLRVTYSWSHSRLSTGQTTAFVCSDSRGVPTRLDVSPACCTKWDFFPKIIKSR
jgi:hypothetical protein